MGCAKGQGVVMYLEPLSPIPPLGQTCFKNMPKNTANIAKSHLGHVLQRHRKEVVDEGGGEIGESVGQTLTSSETRSACPGAVCFTVDGDK